MNKIALATAVVALIATISLAEGRAGAEPAHFVPPPGAAPPWGATTTTEATPAPASASTPAPTPAAAEVPRSTEPPGSGSTTPIHAVFLHAGPSGATPVLGTLRPGEQLRILANAPGGWMQVEAPTGSGWAYKTHLAPPSGAVPPPQDPIAR